MAKSVLVIDDVPDMLQLLDTLFSREGYRVVTADTSFKTMEILERDPPQAVVLDIMMPVRSGIELLQSIRSDSDLAELPVVCISAASMSGEALNFIQESSLGLVDKASLPEAVARIKQALGPP